jgi:hypothetical protein
LIEQFGYVMNKKYQQSLVSRELAGADLEANTALNTPIWNGTKFSFFIIV